jgi:hypothetical protein
VNVPDDVFAFHADKLLHRPVIGKRIHELFQPFLVDLDNRPLATAGKPETRKYKAVFFPGKAEIGLEKRCRGSDGQAMKINQNSADLQFPAINPANAAAREEFRLNTFPAGQLHPARAAGYAATNAASEMKINYL